MLCTKPISSKSCTIVCNINYHISLSFILYIIYHNLNYRHIYVILLKITVKYSWCGYNYDHNVVANISKTPIFSNLNHNLNLYHDINLNGKTIYLQIWYFLKIKENCYYYYYYWLLINLTDTYSCLGRWCDREDVSGCHRWSWWRRAMEEWFRWDYIGWYQPLLCFDFRCHCHCQCHSHCDDHETLNQTSSSLKGSRGDTTWIHVFLLNS